MFSDFSYGKQRANLKIMQLIRRREREKLGFAP